MLIKVLSIYYKESFRRQETVKAHSTFIIFVCVAIFLITYRISENKTLNNSSIY